MFDNLTCLQRNYNPILYITDAQGSADAVCETVSMNFKLWTHSNDLSRSSHFSRVMARQIYILPNLSHFERLASISQIWPALIRMHAARSPRDELLKL